MEALLAELGPALSEFQPGKLVQNPIFMGFVGAALVGIIGLYGRQLFSVLGGIARKLFYDEVQIHSDSDALFYLDLYLQKHISLTWRRNVVITTKVDTDSSDYGPLVRRRGEEQEEIKNPFYFALGGGNHIVFIRGRLCIFSREIEFDKIGKKKQTITLRIFGLNGKKMVLDCISEEMKAQKEDSSLKVWSSNGYGDFNFIGKLCPRSIDSIKMPNGIIEEINEDIEKFKDNEQWYRDRGIVYKRGYLLYGPPGTGKSSLIKALAGLHGRAVYDINLSSMNGDECLAESFSSAARRARESNGLSILSIEDIDCIESTRSREDGSNNGDHVSLKGLLNTLDGILSSENILVIMTTNRKEILDEALIRPGRADKHYFIDLMDKTCVIDYINFFYKTKFPHSFTHVPSGIRIAGAELQDLCMRHPEGKEGIKEVLKALKRRVKCNAIVEEVPTLSNTDTSKRSNQSQLQN